MMRTLTDSFIAAIEAPASGRIEVVDARCRGLVLRAGKGGKSWSYRYRQGKNVQRVSIGAYPAIGLRKARQAADAMRAKVAAGGDPVAERREERAGGRSFATLAERYLKEHAGRHKRAASAAADARNLRKHVLPKWKRRDYRKIERRDVSDLLEGIMTAGKATLANRVQSLVSKIFAFAIDAGLRSDHPSIRMKRRGKENARTRVLTDAELLLFWHGIVEPPAVRRTGLALRLSLLTGCRIGEVAGIRRDELQNIDSPTSAAWVVPADRMKGKKPHLVPLAPMARDTVLALLGMIEPGEQCLLPTRSRTRSGPMRSNSLSQAMANLAGRIEAASWHVDQPRAQDLRRTVSTRLAALGIPKEHRDRTLSRIARDVDSKHYNQHDYQGEKRAALMRWESALGVILNGGGTVVAFSDRRAV